MDLNVLMQKLKWHYDRHGGNIEVCIGVGRETYQVKDVAFDDANDRIVIY